LTTDTNSKPLSGASSCGYHFVNSFQDCPRRWFLQYEQRIVPRYTGKALSFGLAWHKAIETFYSGADEPQALAGGLAVLNEAHENDRYQYPEDYDNDIRRFPTMFSVWVETVGLEVLSRYNVLALEDTISLELPNGFVFTGRLDETLESKETGAVLIAEHKSTSFSLTEMERTVFVGDQLPGYSALLRYARPGLAPRFNGCLLDVTYQKGSRCEARLSALYYDEAETSRFVLNITGLLSELSQKIEALHSGVSDALLFPRNGTACSRFRCPYEPVCRKFVDSTTDLPETLIRMPEAKTFDIVEELGE